MRKTAKFAAATLSLAVIAGGAGLAPVTGYTAEAGKLAEGKKLVSHIVVNGDGNILNALGEFGIKVLIIIEVDGQIQIDRLFGCCYRCTGW